LAATRLRRPGPVGVVPGFPPAGAGLEASAGVVPALVAEPEELPAGGPGGPPLPPLPEAVGPAGRPAGPVLGLPPSGLVLLGSWEPPAVADADRVTPGESVDVVAAMSATAGGSHEPSKTSP